MTLENVARRLCEMREQGESPIYRGRQRAHLEKMLDQARAKLSPEHWGAVHAFIQDVMADDHQDFDIRKPSERSVLWQAHQQRG